MYFTDSRRLTLAGARKMMATGALEDAIRRTAESAEFAQASERLGVRPAFMPADEFARLIAREDAELARLMQLIGLRKQ